MQPTLAGACARLLCAAVMTALAAASMTGCGDDDTVLPPPGSAATLTAGADTFALDWNAAATLDVLANDRASSGTLSLAGVGAAAHGSVAIVDGKVVYTPAPGYFGPDSFESTARADRGGATAIGTATVSIEARLRLAGNISDAPLANATVTVSIGESSFTSVADAAGDYRLDVRTARPGDMVTVSAIGTGAQSMVKLLTLAGDAATLVAAAGGGAEVSSAQLPALDATHLSTASAVLVLRSGTPANQAALDDAKARADNAELLRLATIIRLIADKGVALPAGAGDTLALLQDRALLQSFNDAQVDGDYDRYLATRAEVLAQAPLKGRIDALAATADQTLVYQTGYLGGYATAIVTFGRDGSASIDAFGWHVDGARWVRNGATVTLTLAAPLDSIGISQPDPATDEQYTVLDSMTGMVIRHLSGDIDGGSATVAKLGTQTYLDGPFAGQATPWSAASYGQPTGIDRVINLARRLDIDAASLAVGARIGGVLLGAFGTGSPLALKADILRIDGAGTGTLEMAQERVEWSLADRWLQVRRANGQSYRYARLVSDGGNGQEFWLARSESQAIGRPYEVTALVRADAAPAFDAASAAHRWAYADLGAEFSGTEPFVSLYGDGSGLRQGSGRVTWSLDALGRLSVQSYLSDGTLRSDRRWTLLKRSGGEVQVLEDARFYFAGQLQDELSRVRWLTDQGAAVKP